MKFLNNFINKILPKKEEEENHSNDIRMGAMFYYKVYNNYYSYYLSLENNTIKKEINAALDTTDCIKSLRVISEKTNAYNRKKDEDEFEEDDVRKAAYLLSKTIEEFDNNQLSEEEVIIKCISFISNLQTEEDKYPRNIPITHFQQYG